MIKELHQLKNMDVVVYTCDVYRDSICKDCYDLVVELHTIGAVSDELLLHTTGMK